MFSLRGWIDRAGRPFLPVFFIVALLLLTGMGTSPLSAAEGEGSGSTRPVAPSQGVWFEQVVTHPFTDWNGDGRVSPLDEHLVLRNHGPGRAELDGWLLLMMDGTDEEMVLEGGLDPGEPLVVMNPPGRINNDVALRLVDQGGEVVDELALGADGIPVGRGDSVLDEAVHLAGPWAGLRAPGALGKGLGPVWVSHLAAEGTVDHAKPLRPAWVEPAGGVLVVRLVTAPGHVHGPFEVRAGEWSIALQPVDEEAGLWRTKGPLGPFDGNVSLELVGEELVLGSFPSGPSLDLLVDPVIPSFVPLEWSMGNGTDGLLQAVADSDGRIRWFPSVETGESGLVDVVVRDEQGNVLEDCVPLEEPGPGCVLGSGGNVSVELISGAGRTAHQRLPVVVWDDPPEVPQIVFEPASMPTLHWEPPSRPTTSLMVEVAQDPEGTWRVDEHEVPVDSRGFVDPSWVPGDPRAYRLVVTDLADNQGVGPWIVLEPEDVPVQVVRDEVDLSPLGTMGETVVTFRFDRPLQTPPVLALRLERPVPLYLEVEGEPIVSEDAYAYQIVLPTRIDEAVGSWSLVGGRGEDGAPVDGPVHNLTWDAGAPRVRIDGTATRWIPAARHVLTVQAVDGVDPAPVVSFSGPPPGVKVDGEGPSARLVVHEEGSFEIDGAVRDASGNEKGFVVRLDLDATPPEVKELERPGSWSPDDLLRFRVRDEGSGVNGSSLKVWARDRAGVFDVVVDDEGNGTFKGVPKDRSEPVVGPYEVYVAVADQAGNGVEGFLSQRMVRVPVVGNHTDPTGKLAPGPGPSPVPAPAFLGPPWGEDDDRADASVGGLQSANASSQEASRWDAFSWDEVPPEEEKRPWVWYVVALVGAVTLGTAVHRVRSGRNRSKDDPSGVEAGRAHADRHDREDPGEGAAAVSCREEEDAPGDASVEEETARPMGSDGEDEAEREGGSGSRSDVGGEMGGEEQRGVSIQSRLDRWGITHPCLQEGQVGSAS